MPTSEPPSYPFNRGLSTMPTTDTSRAATIMDNILANPRAVKRIIALLITAWPIALGLMGLPTGAAETAVDVYTTVTGETTPVECPVCPVCETVEVP